MRNRSCPDCEEALTRISLVDQQGQGRTSVGLAFTADEEPRTSAWSGKLKNQAGTVQGWLCEGCSRVLMYAESGA